MRYHEGFERSDILLPAEVREILDVAVLPGGDDALVRLRSA